MKDEEEGSPAAAVFDTSPCRRPLEDQRTGKYIHSNIPEAERDEFLLHPLIMLQPSRPEEDEEDAFSPKNSPEVSDTTKILISPPLEKGSATCEPDAWPSRVGSIFHVPSRKRERERDPSNLFVCLWNF